MRKPNTRDCGLCGLTTLVVRHNLRMPGHSFKVLDDLRRDAVDKVLRYMVERARPEPSDEMNILRSATVSACQRKFAAG